MEANKTERSPNSATQTAVNHAVGVVPIASLAGWWLSTKGLPPEVVAPASAVMVSVLTTVGTIVRNVAKEKGWAKYIA